MGKRQQPTVNGGPVEIADTAPSLAKPLRANAVICGKPIQVYIDSGAWKNLISPQALEQLGIHSRKKEEHRRYQLVAVDGSPLQQQSWVTQETFPLKMQLDRHEELLTLDVVRMAKHLVVLGLPWLETHNPRINWKLQRIEFDGCDCANRSKPRRNNAYPGDEFRAEIGFTAESSTERPKWKSTRDSDPTDIPGATGSQQVRSTDGKRDHPVYPEEYKEWSALFEEEEGAYVLPKHQPWDHEIKLQPGSQPTFGPLYKCTGKELASLKKYIEEGLAKGIIRKSESPAASPILQVPKKDGTLRPCVDFRKLNAITVKNRYPLPNISELQERLQGARWFTAFDLKLGFNLIRMKEGEEWKTAFRTRYGLYEYTVMPFGLTNAPATFQAMINDTLRDILDEYAIAYLDDVLVYTSGTLDEHKEHVKQVLRRLFSRNLKLNPKKCEFHRKRVKYLGHLIGREGIQMDPEKVRAIADWPIPTTVKEVQGFLGFVNFNRTFIKSYSSIAEPLTRLTKKDEPFNWTIRQEEAFNELKLACCQEPVLKLFDPQKPVRLETDASDLAIGACLSQEYDGKWHPVAFYSRKMSLAEQNYDIHDKELLAIVSAFGHWRTYLEGAPKTDVYTDHKNLLYFTTTKELNRRQTRWSEKLGQYKFQIHYTPGKDNGRADALSRRSDYMVKDITNRAILRIASDGSLEGNTQEIGLTTMILEDEDEEFPVSHKKLNIPHEQIWDCIRQHHDPPKFGHPGITNTVKAIQRSCHFKDMKRHVTEFIKQCESCQKNKHSTLGSIGNNTVIEKPTKPWQSITMDFITKLPGSMDPLTGIEYDSIWVIVDRFTKWTHLLPFKESYNAKQLDMAWQDRIARLKGEPGEIISDRDKLFTSAFWTTMRNCWGTKLKHSTAYHPQTDGQTERANQTLEQWLRHYINWEMDNWVELLPLAEQALGNRYTDSIRSTPYEATYLTPPRTRPPLTPKMLSEEALQRVERQRRNEPQLKKGDRVYLLTKNLKTPRPTKKLDHKKVGPFLLQEVLGPRTFRLLLPPDAKVRSVFDLSLLTRASDQTPLATAFNYQHEGQVEFEVEKIVAKGPRGYLVKWKDYPDNENTWEPAQNLQNCQQKLREFEDTLPGRSRVNPLDNLSQQRRSVRRKL